MTTKTRTDVHRPSTIIPADYTHVMEFGREYAGRDGSEFFEEWTGMNEAIDLYEEHGAYVHGGGHRDRWYAVLRCDHCGARYKYGSLFRHEPTGEIISVGHDCAASIGLAYDEAWAKRIQDNAARVRKVELERRERFHGLRTFARANRSVLALLKVDHHITKDIRSKLISTGARWGLSEKQVNLLAKLAVDASKPAEKHVAVPVDGERIRIEGTVVSTKWKDSDYGGGLKMTVKVETPEGSWLVWGSVPDALYNAAHHADQEAYQDFVDSAKLAVDATPEAVNAFTKACADYRANRMNGLKGRKVGFTAKVTRGSDSHFGFFSRPTKPELL